MGATDAVSVVVFDVDSTVAAAVRMVPAERDSAVYTAAHMRSADNFAAVVEAHTASRVQAAAASPSPLHTPPPRRYAARRGSCTVLCASAISIRGCWVALAAHSCRSPASSSSAQGSPRSPSVDVSGRVRTAARQTLRCFDIPPSRGKVLAVRGALAAVCFRRSWMVVCEDVSPAPARIQPGSGGRRRAVLTVRSRSSSSSRSADHS